MSPIRTAWRHLAVSLVFGVIVLWLAGLVAAPYVLAQQGSGGRDVSLWVRTMYLAGAAVCHQRPERSFHPWGAQMPVCARCFGLYAGAPLGALLASCFTLASGDRFRDTRRWRQAALVAALPTLMLVMAEASTLAHPSAVWRAMGAAPLGVAVAALVMSAVSGRLR